MSERRAIYVDPHLAGRLRNTSVSAARAVAAAFDVADPDGVIVPRAALETMIRCLDEGSGWLDDDEAVVLAEVRAALEASR